MPNWCTNNIIIVDKPKWFGEIDSLTRSETKKVEALPISGKAKDVIASILDEKGNVDFNKLIPMPKSLAIESGTRTTQGIELYLTSVNPALEYPKDIKKMLPEQFFALWKQLDKEMQYGTLRSCMSEGEYLAEYSDELYQLGKTACDNMTRYNATTWYEWCWTHWDTKWNACDAEVHEGVLTFNTAWNPPVSVLSELSEKYSDVLICNRWESEGGKASNLILSNGHCYERYLTKEELIEIFGEERFAPIDGEEICEGDNEEPVYHLSDGK